MIEAILLGRKKQTRRTKLLDTLVFDEESGYVFFNKHKVQLDIHTWKEDILKYCPYGKVGDVLWVRESFYKCVTDAFKGKFFYKQQLKNACWDFKCKPSIHMPKSACRIFLRITNIRVERLQDISEEDAKNEGVEIVYPGDNDNHVYMDYMWHSSSMRTAKQSFQTLWQSINGEQSWNDNPWVWVIEFERIEKPSEFTFS
jgi:hypothetical protein